MSIGSLPEAAVAHIRNLILTGRLLAGTHLQEVQIAMQLGMSRTPIREALSVLAREGLLEAGPKRGYKVRGFRGSDIRNALEVRSILEGTACRILAERGLGVVELDRLDRILIEGDALLKREQTRDRALELYMEINYQFHSGILAATENQMLIRTVELAQNLPIASARHIHSFHKRKEYYDFLRRAADDHRQIFDAIAARKSYRAEALMREHIWASAELLQTQLKDDEISNSRFFEKPDILASKLPIAS